MLVQQICVGECAKIANGETWEVWFDGKNESFNVNLIKINNIVRGMNVIFSTELQINKLFRLTHL